MEPNTIETHEQYEAALAKVERLMDREIAAGSEEFVQLDQLSQLVEEYEKAKFPIDAPTPTLIPL